jgi:hypothetical protein
MKRSGKHVFGSLLVVVALLLGGVIFSVADDYVERKEHGGKDGGKHQNKEGHGSSHGKQLIANTSYEKSCGGCHWAYAPVLLPSKSWENIMATLNDHFGNEVIISAQQKSDVSSFLFSNSSENTSAKIGRKITQSLGGVAPARVVEVPYIQKKHRKIDRAIFSRKSIKSLSNCIACHPSASDARFDDDDVKIPSE